MAIFIGELSRKTGVNIETIRYYERIGVLSKPPRSEGGHRIYAEEHLKRLTFVHRARELGFALAEIRALLSLADGGDYACDEVRDMTRHHLRAVRRRITDLRRMARVLRDVVAECEGGNVPDCPILDALFEGRGSADRA
ncbi:MAG: transcriptional regulator [Rhodospirillaceae bacterium]|nr:MAG: transcriptional regulator [Rhodospirillaceae bacterium]